MSESMSGEIFDKICSSCFVWCCFEEIGGILLLFGEFEIHELFYLIVGELLMKVGLRCFMGLFLF